MTDISGSKKKRKSPRPMTPEEKAAVVAKRKRTMLERHGTTVFGAADSKMDKEKRSAITEKRAETLLEKNGSLSTKLNMTDEEKRIANEKREQTNLHRHGVKNGFQVDKNLGNTKGYYWLTDGENNMMIPETAHFVPNRNWKRGMTRGLK